MKKILLSLLLISTILSVGCGNYGQNYHYTYKVKITYQNGDVDTVLCGMDGFKENEATLYLKTSESGVLVSGGTPSCLMVGCGFYGNTVACGVRKYVVLYTEKVAITNDSKDLHFEVK